GSALITRESKDAGGSESACFGIDQGSLMLDKNEDFIKCLDDQEMRCNSDWGARLAEELDCRLLRDEDFCADRVENLVAGFSNACQLDCPFCGVHKSAKLGIPGEELEMDRLIALVNRHFEQTGLEVGHFRIGNTGEPLIHKRLTELIDRTQHAVNYYSIISNMNVRDRKVIDFIARHPKVDWINVSCDAGDGETYGRLRVGGNFDIVFDNARTLIRAGKRLVLNAILFKENEESLLKLPARIAGEGFKELHLFYPLTHSETLAEYGLHKHSLDEFRDFFIRIRKLCDSHSLPVTTDGWVFRPELIGVIPAIETEAMFEAYSHHPCDALYHLILYPSGTFNNCSILNRLGLAGGEKSAAFYSQELMEMLNDPQVLTMRKLQILGHFPQPCKAICGKRDRPRDEEEARLIIKVKYPGRNAILNLDEFTDYLEAKGDTFAIRAFSPAGRSVLEAYPRLRERLELIIDRDPKLAYEGCGVIPPEAVPRSAEGKNLIVLVASDRGAVLTSVIEQAAHFKEIHKLIVSGSDPKDFSVQRLLP
ncbi:MAG: radical SAM protein, partial [Acidobacteriota bacterium]